LRRARRCGECGFEAARESDTLRNRRHVFRAIAAIVAIVAIVLAARVRALEQGPWTLVPTRVLLAASPFFGDGSYRSVQGELAARITNARLDDAQLAAAVELVVKGDADAQPRTPAWESKYGKVATALLRALPRTDPLLLRFLEIPPSYLVMWHSAPEGRPRLVGIDASADWPAGIEAKVAITLPDGSVRRARFNPTSGTNSLIVELPASMKVGRPIRLAMSVRPRGGDSAPWIDYPAVDATPDEVGGRGQAEPDAKPIDSQELRDAVMQVFAFEPMLSIWSDGTPRAGLSFNPAGAQGAEFKDTLFGLRVEICENGAVRRTSRIWWGGGTPYAQARWMPPIEDLDAMARLFAQDPSLDSNWTLRITGDADLADYARPAVGAHPTRDTFRRWSGSVELPLKLQRISAPAPMRRWTLEK
jgi:hypothetical protein